MKLYITHDKLLSQAYDRLPSRLIDICIISILFLSFLSIGCATTTQTKKDKAATMTDMGLSLFLQGNAREGLAYFLEAAELDPNNPDIEHQLALVYKDIGEYSLALQHFKKAISLKPNYPEAVNNMGTLYSNMREWDKALECFQEAASDIMYTTPHFAYHNIGLVYFYKGEYQRAIENYQKALKLSPTYVNVYYDLASAYIAQNRSEEAIETYKKAAAISTQPWQANLSLAQLYIKLDRKQEAIDLLKSIIESNPRNQAAKDANQLLETIRGR